MKRFCTNCGNEISANTAFCDNCGTPTGNVTVAESTGSSRQLDASVRPGPEPRSGRGRRPVLIAGAATIAIAIAIGGVWWVLGVPQFDKDKAATAKKSSETAAKSDSSGSRTSDEGILGRPMSKAGKGGEFVGTWQHINQSYRMEIVADGDQFLVSSRGIRSPAILGKDGTLTIFTGPQAQVMTYSKSSDAVFGVLGEYRRVSLWEQIAEQRQQIFEGVLQVSGAKTAIAEFYNRHRRLPNANELSNWPPKISATGPIESIALLSNGGVEAKFRPSVAGGGTIVLSPDAGPNGITWKCANTFPPTAQHVIPPACGGTSTNKVGEFGERNRLETFISPGAFKANSLIYKDKSIGILLRFLEMRSASSGVFGHPTKQGQDLILVTDLPKTLFSTPQSALMAVKVIGITTLDEPTGKRTIPQVKYLDSIKCQSQDCIDQILDRGIVQKLLFGTGPVG